MTPLKKTPGNTKWFTEARFGMFIHWGLYAMPARHEWIKKYETIPEEKYDTYFKYFEPDLYNPSEWAKAAAQAGMKYFVITTKHHEGFCLWDSKLTDYKAPNTPAKRDLLRPMIEAFRNEGLRVGLYHSLIDWHHPEFRIDDTHCLHKEPDRKKLNENRDQKKYAKYLHGQVEELLTQFGKVDILWFDFSYPAGKRGIPADYDGKGAADWMSEDLYKIVRKLAPEVILNDRLDMDEGWDVKTPEQFTPKNGVQVNGEPVVWEACQTFSGSWGYFRDEHTWRTGDELIRTLIDSVSKNGNLLLNVGPTARGEFDYRALERLSIIGEWMKRHGKSVYGCGAAPETFPVPRDCRYTWNESAKRLYLHIFAWPHRFIPLEGLAGKIDYAQFLHDGSEVTTAAGEWYVNQGLCSKDDAVITLPHMPPKVTVPVIELFLK